MTFQPPPPPPPPGGNPPPPPPGAYGPPPGGDYGAPPQPGGYGTPPGGGYPARQGGGFDPKTVNPLDWAILGIGFLTFIFSFVSYYTFSQGGFSVSESAWHGFFGWFAMLCALAGSAVIALALFMPGTKLPMSNRLIGLGLYAVATLCVILALFVTPSYLGIDVPSSVDEGHGFGYWISLILIIAGLVISLMRLQASGEKLPGALAGMPNIGNRGPRGGFGGGPGQPGAQPGPHPGPGPGPGYGPGPGPGDQPPPPPGYGPPR